MNSKQDKDFYVWVMENCIKTTYEWWGIDMTSMFSHVEEDLPNAAKALRKMYLRLRKPYFYKAQPLTFDEPKYVYEAIENLIPLNQVLRFDLKTKEQSLEYDWLNMCSWDRYVKIYRIDLLLAALLFTEEFIFQPLTDAIVDYSENKLTVHGTYVLFKVSRHTEKTYISIRVRGVMLLQYEILN